MTNIAFPVPSVHPTYQANTSENPRNDNMPTIPVSLPAMNRASSGVETALPQVLSTPSGLAILEIQGTVNTPPPTPQSNGARSSPVGKLVFPHYNSSMAADDTSWHKRVYLYVGEHQRLAGEVKKLAKPVAIIRRRTSDSDELEIAEIVHHKLLFAHRPEPVGGGE